MTLLILTNDDGFDAPGIRALETALADKSLGTVLKQTNRPSAQQTDALTIATVAPDAPHSGCSHQMNRGGTIAIDERSPNEYAIGGTPADCSRVAISHLYPEADWVLSGINAGGNMGADTYLSGTVAAVREAVLLRKQAIALSQYRYRDQPFNWPRASRLTAKVLAQLMTEPLPEGQFWNVNLPAPPLAPPRPGTDTEKTAAKDDPDIVFCEACTQPLPTEFAVDAQGFRYVGAYEDRLRDADGDVAVCLGGGISIVKIRLW